MGWDVNVHVNLQVMMILMPVMMILMPMMMMMMRRRRMMMMMTLMKLVNSATKFRHGIDKFYQPNSGLRSSRPWDEAIYTYMYMYIHTYI